MLKSWMLRFTQLENRYMYGVDQVPDPFELETYDPIGAGSKQGVRVIVGKEGADTKRFCTIQILYRMTGSSKLGTTHSDVVGDSDKASKDADAASEAEEGEVMC